MENSITIQLFDFVEDKYTIKSNLCAEQANKEMTYRTREFLG